MKQTDILVIGGGLAAIKSAITASRSGLRVTMAVKTRLCGGASFYPMMDMVACQCATGVPEEDESYLSEIMDASLGMADEEMNRIYIRDIAQRVLEFPELGVDNAALTDPKVACFAKMARPTYAWGDWPHIRKNLRRILAQTPNIELLEGHSLLSLLKTDGAISGAVLLCHGERIGLAAKSVVLATGGMGDLYAYNLNTPDVSGDGQALALTAGADLINLEFLQFIPGFVSPAYKTVFRETTIPYLAGLADADGNDLLAQYLPDETERAECLRLRSAHGPFTCRTGAKWFDIAMMEEILKQGEPLQGFPIRYKAEIAQSQFTFVGPYVRWLKREHGVDLARDVVYIAPFYHAANGGVKIGKDCETSIPGLFACGEVSGGIHGADRLGGQSTGSCLVFGRIAGENAARYASGCTQRTPQCMDEALARDYHGQGNLAPDDLLAPIRGLMYRAGGIIREERSLESALGQLRDWQAQYNALDWLNKPQAAAQAAKAMHFLVLGQALLSAMLCRRESRGSHFRQDHPETSGGSPKRHIVRFKSDAYHVVEE